MGDHKTPVRFAVLGLAALILAACMCSALPVSAPGAGSVGGPDGGDGYTTTGGGPITLGTAQTAGLNSLFEAHNWFLDGTQGQSITITAVGHLASGGLFSSLFDPASWTLFPSGGPIIHFSPAPPTYCDPRVKLIAPDGSVLTEDDDGGGGASGLDSLLTATLPADGRYTIRVDVFREGRYTITVR